MQMCSTVTNGLQRLLEMNPRRVGINTVFVLVLDRKAAEESELPPAATPLQFFCRRADRIECVRYCLEHGADPNFKDDLTHHRTALFDAIVSKNLPAVKALLDFGADVSVVGRCFWPVEALPRDMSAFLFGCAIGFIDALPLLLDAVFDPSKRNCSDMTRALFDDNFTNAYLLCAGSRDPGPALEWVLSPEVRERLPYDLLSCDIRYNNALHFLACSVRHNTESVLSAYNRIKEFGINVNARNADDANPFYYAMFWKSPLVDVLLEIEDLDLNMDIVSKQTGRSILSLAARSGHIKTLERLCAVATYKQLNLKAFSGMTPLGVATVNGQTESVRTLLKPPHCHLLDLELQRTTGRTALNDAVQYDEDEIARMLIEHGANVNAEDHNGLSPFTAAFVGQKKLGLARMMLKHGANVNVVHNGVRLWVQIGSNYPEDFVIEFLKAGCDLTAAGPANQTILMHMAACGFVDAVQYILEHAPPSLVEAKDERNETVLHYAVSSSLADEDKIAAILQMLLRPDALWRIDATSRSTATGRTASDKALSFKYEVAYLMLKHVEDEQAAHGVFTDDEKPE
jgi:ankyrin repeat protein